MLEGIYVRGPFATPPEANNRRFVGGVGLSSLNNHTASKDIRSPLISPTFSEQWFLKGSSRTDVRRLISSAVGPQIAPTHFELTTCTFSSMLTPTELVSPFLRKRPGGLRPEEGQSAGQARGCLEADLRGPARVALGARDRLPGGRLPLPEPALPPLVPLALPCRS